MQKKRERKRWTGKHGLAHEESPGNVVRGLTEQTKEKDGGRVRLRQEVGRGYSYLEAATK